MSLGPTELIIILLIVLLLFGVGRVSRIGGELGQAVSSFRKGLRSGQDDQNDEEKADAADESKTKQA